MKIVEIDRKSLYDAKKSLHAKMQRFFMIIMNLAFYYPIFSAEGKHTNFFMSKRAGSQPFLHLWL